MIRKGQIALEFIIIVGVAIMIMMLFLVASDREISQITNQKGRVLLKDVVFRTQEEINLASEALSGYERRFTNPVTLDGIPYNMSIVDTELVGYISTYEFLLITPQVVGDAKIGKNYVRNVNGLICLNDGCASFDTTSPRIETTSPLNGTNGILLNRIVTAEFDESMDETTLLIAFTLSGTPGTIIYNDTFYVVSFEPSSPLLPNMLYTATITTAAKDKSGNRLNQTYQWEFQTGADLTAPGDVIGLGETATGQDFILWNWTNPADADFSHSEIYLNGTWMTNISSESYLASGLLPNSTYEIALVTWDTNDNSNPTAGIDQANTTTVSAFFVDLWDMYADRPNPVDFTSGLNSSSDTFGPAGGDDGWDTEYHAYDSGSTYYGSPTDNDIVEFDASGGLIQVKLGGYGDPSPGPAYNDPISAAYGVEFTISPAMQAAIDLGATATLEFDWASIDVTGIEHPFEAVWLKARIWNSSGADYLGSDLDSDSNPADDDDMDAITDSTNDLYYRLQPNGADATGHFSENVSSYITAAGNYYVDFGAKLSDWSAFDETYIGRYDNINLTIT